MLSGMRGTERDPPLRAVLDEALVLSIDKPLRGVRGGERHQASRAAWPP